MVVRYGGANSQRELFPSTLEAMVMVDPNHRLVQLTDLIDWTQLIALAQDIRSRKLKNNAGKPPHLRELMGALVLRSINTMTYRETEDQIRYHVPSRYLCGLMQSSWTPDHNTIQDFEQLLGEGGVRLINEFAVKLAVSKGFANPTMVVADTTAQEAMAPYPNEMGLMASFIKGMNKAAKGAGKIFHKMVENTQKTIEAAKKKYREYHLFGKEKSKQAKGKLVSEMVRLIETVHQALGKSLQLAQQQGKKFKGQTKKAYNTLVKLHATMEKLLPQIEYWLKTGKVVSGKIISMYIPELYSIVRGKVGKKVEFGLQWGMTRLGGGFLMATMGLTHRLVADARYAIDAVKQIKEIFGVIPKKYGYDRGGYSQENVEALREMGVKEIGVAPRGQAQWEVQGAVKDALVRERAQVEGCIGVLKQRKYGFNRPQVRSVGMMGVCGQRAVLGFNLNKLLREVANVTKLALVG